MTDHAASWSEPKLVTEPPGYFVLNNDRVIQTARGRLIVPVVFNRSLNLRVRSRSAGLDSCPNDYRGIALWYYSDDEGASWREADTWWAMPVATAAGLQEPGVVELGDGSLFSWARTDQGTQYGFRSQDGGVTWSAPQPTELKSPCSPATIKRLPHSRDLLAIYSDHSGRFPFISDENPYRKRTTRGGRLLPSGYTWPNRKLLEDDPNQEFSYPAIYFDGDSALIAYNAWGQDRPAPGRDAGPPHRPFLVPKRPALGGAGPFERYEKLRSSGLELRRPRSASQATIPSPSPKSAERPPPRASRARRGAADFRAAEAKCCAEAGIGQQAHPALGDQGDERDRPQSADGAADRGQLATAT